MFPQDLKERLYNYQNNSEVQEQLEDFFVAVRCLLKNGETKAAILLIQKCFPE